MIGQRLPKLHTGDHFSKYIDTARVSLGLMSVPVIRPVPAIRGSPEPPLPPCFKGFG
jgi:hypothetical protein